MEPTSTGLACGHATQSLCRSIGQLTCPQQSKAARDVPVDSLQRQDPCQEDCQGTA